MPEIEDFVCTQDGDADIRDAAMRVGAAGYVLKAKRRPKNFYMPSQLRLGNTITRPRQPNPDNPCPQVLSVRPQES